MLEVSWQFSSRPHLAVCCPAARLTCLARVLPSPNLQPSHVFPGLVPSYTDRRFLTSYLLFRLRPGCGHLARAGSLPPSLSSLRKNHNGAPAPAAALSLPIMNAFPSNAGHISGTLCGWEGLFLLCFPCPLALTWKSKSLWTKCMAGLPWLGLCPGSLPALVLLCRKAARPSVWDKRDRGHGENPALTFIQETRWVAPGSGCQPCGQARLETHNLACHCPELQPQPQDPTCSHHRCRWEGALGDWTLLLIH